MVRGFDRRTRVRRPGCAQHAEKARVCRSLIWPRAVGRQAVRFILGVDAFFDQAIERPPAPATSRCRLHRMPRRCMSLPARQPVTARTMR